MKNASLIRLFCFFLLVIQLEACTAKKNKKGDDPESPQKDIETSQESSEPRVVKEPECGPLFIEELIPVIAPKYVGIPYSSKDLADCSGIFHRVLREIGEECPSKKSKLPSIQSRSSRAIGQWYYNNGGFHRVSDPLKSEKLIKPGMVMFYGGKSQDFYNSHSIDKFWEGGGIRHVGIVVEVKRDQENGNVLSYELLHGRYTGKPSTISGKKDYMHLRTPSRGKYPSFGNGKDPLIGMAEIFIE